MLRARTRLAGRAVTGPGAFLLAGLLDGSLLLVAYARWRMAQRRRGPGC
jgi:hypothetical protein